MQPDVQHREAADVHYLIVESHCGCLSMFLRDVFSLCKQTPCACGVLVSLTREQCRTQQRSVPTCGLWSDCMGSILDTPLFALCPRKIFALIFILNWSTVDS